MKNKINDLTPEEKKQLREELVRQEKSKLEEAITKKKSFSEFLKGLGLNVLARKIADNLDYFWNVIKEIIDDVIKNSN